MTHKTFYFLLFLTKNAEATSIFGTNMIEYAEGGARFAQRANWEDACALGWDLTRKHDKAKIGGSLTLPIIGKRSSQKMMAFPHQTFGI